MRFMLIVLALAVACQAEAQDKAAKKKKAVAAHKKPTPEQIRKFEKLQKQKQREAKG